MNSAVQEEIKVKDPQKTKIQALVETANQRQQQIREQFRPPGQQGQGGRRNGNNGNANGQANNGNGGDPNAGNGGGQNGGGNGQFGGGQNGGGGGQFGGGQNGGGGGGYGMGPGGWGGWGGMNLPGGWGGWGMGGPGGWGGMGGPGGNGPGGGRGNRGQQDPEMAQRFAQMREAMNELEQATEQSLAKILDRPQYGRLKQIQLQMASIPGLLRPDMVEKLNLNEEQVEQIQGLLRESGQARMENGRARFDMMREAFPDAFNRNNGQNGNGNGQNGNGQNDNGQNGNGQNGNGQNGNGNGRGGRANFRDPAFREAMQKFMDRPETKAKMEEIRVQDEKIQNQLTAAVNRVLTKRQAAAYKKMLGAPFDMSKIWGGPGRGPGNRGRNANPADTTKAAGKTQASGAANGEDAATAKPAAKGNGSSTAKPKRKSLRELRGLDQ